MAKGNCEFKGTGGEYFLTTFIHLTILSAITFGIYTPWALVKLWKLKASHTTINGNPVNFAGTGRELLVIFIINGLLTLITFGLYGPWALCKIIQWRLQHTIVKGRPSQFSGTGGSLFLFYLIHLMLLPLFTLGLYYLYGVFRFYAWKEERTRYGGEKTTFGAPFGGFLKLSVISWILNVVTFSLFTPWAMCMLYKWQIEGLSVGDSAQIKPFPPVKTNYVAVAALVVIGLLPFAGAGYFFMQMVDRYDQQIRTLTKTGNVQRMKMHPPKKTRQPVKRTVKPPKPTTVAKPPEAEGKKTKGPDYSQELRVLEDLIMGDPNNADILYNRAWILAEQGHFEKALEDYSRVVENNDRYAEAYHNRGLVYIKTNKYDLALNDFNTAIKLDPSSADTYCNRGNVHYQMGKRDLAIDDYSQALKLNPEDGDIYYNRGLVFLATGQKEKAMGDFKKAAKMGHSKAADQLKSVSAAPVSAGEKKTKATAGTGTQADIFKLIFKGDTVKVKEMLASDPGLVNAKDKKGDTPLHQAAFWGKLDIAKELVKAGAKINQPGNLKNTPLHNAAFMGRVDVVQFLLEKKADLKAGGNVGATPLHSAVRGRENKLKIEIVKRLLEARSDINALDKMGQTPLHNAVFYNNPQIVELLINKGAKLDIKDSFGKTPLAQAVKGKKNNVINVLKKHGAKM